jgi:hypothetical protein
MCIRIAPRAKYYSVGNIYTHTSNNLGQEKVSGRTVQQ